MVGGEVLVDLGDYSLVSTDEQVIGALKEGFGEALKTLHGLNMAPSPNANAKNSMWFNKPWFFEN